MSGVERAGLRSRLWLTALSVIILGWALPQMVAHVGRGATASSTFRLVASPRADVVLLSVTDEGRRVALDTLVRSDGWEDWSYALAYRQRSGPGTIAIEGHRPTVCFATSRYAGVVRVEDASGAGRDIDLFRDITQSTSTCTDLDAGRVDTGATHDLRAGGWVLLPLALALILWRPWRSWSRLGSWVVAQTAVLHVLTWLLQDIGYNSDAPGYVSGVPDVFKGVASYFPAGYPLFVAPAVLLWPQWTGFLVTGVQHVAMVVVLVALWRLTRSSFGEGFALLGLIVAGSVAPTIFLPQMMLSENAALIGITGAVWFASRAGERRVVRNDMLAGVFAGFATLVRAVPLAAVVLSVAALHIRFGDRRSFRRPLRIIAVAVAVVALDASWNFVRSGDFALSDSSGLHLYDRVVSQQLLLDREAPATRRFLAAIGSYPISGVGHWEIREVLGRAGMPEDESIPLLGDVAREGLRSQPLTFLAYSTGQAWREFRAVPLIEPWCSGTPVSPDLESPIPAAVRGTPTVWWNRMTNVYRGLWPALLVAAILGVALAPWSDDPRTILALAAVPVGYMLATAQIEFFMDRYAVAVLPFALILTPAPLAVLTRLWRSRRAGRPQ